MDTNFSKNFSQVTDSEWNEIYMLRAAHGKFFSSTIHDGASLKEMYLQSMKQEEAAKHILESAGYTVSYNDPLREVIYALPKSNSSAPDLSCLLPNGKTKLVEVKNIKFTSSTRLRLRFNLWMHPGEFTSKQDVIDAIWKYDFHDADYVMFITPDLKDYGLIRKDDIKIMQNDVPDFNSYGRTQVVFYADVEGWRKA